MLLSTGNAKQKADTLNAARMLQKKGYKLYATDGSSKFLTENGVENTRVYWPSEEGQPQALDMLHKKEIDMVVNIPKNLTAGELDNGYKIRRAAIDLNIPLITKLVWQVVYNAFSIDHRQTLPSRVGKNTSNQFFVHFIHRSVR